MNAAYPELIELVELAVKAPSGHNTQPWLFRSEGKEIIILPDFSKELPVVDGDHRELFISLGCAAENLCVSAAAFNFLTEVRIEPLPNQSAAIHIHLERSAETLEAPLHREVLSRQTNRSVYSGEIIQDEVLNSLTDIHTEPDAHFYLYKNGSDTYNTLKEFIRKGNEVQMNDPAFKEELKSWMRYNKKHSYSTCDGLSYAVFGAPNLPKFLSKAIMSSVLKSSIQNKGDMKKLASSSHLALFTTRNNTIGEWIRLGITLQRFLLKATSQNITTAFLNQPCEVKELAEEIQKELPVNGTYPTLLLRIGYAKRMPYSLRRDVISLLLNP